MTLPSLGSAPGATSSNLAAQLRLRLERGGDGARQRLARGGGFGVQRHDVLLARARHDEP